MPACVRLAWATATALGSVPANGSALLTRASGREPCATSMTVPPTAQRTRAVAATTRAGHRRAGAFARGVGSSTASRPPSGSAGVSMTSWSAADSSPQKSRAGLAGSCRRESSRSTSAALADGPNGTSSSGGPSHSRGSRTTFSASGAAARSLPPLASLSSNLRRMDLNAAVRLCHGSALFASADGRG